MTHAESLLIAEFMGYKIVQCRNGKAFEAPVKESENVNVRGKTDDPFKIHGSLVKCTDLTATLSSMDAIMLVLRKMQDLWMGDVRDVSEHELIDQVGVVELLPLCTVKSEIDETIIKFIRWYNKHKI